APARGELSCVRGCRRGGPRRPSPVAGVRMPTHPPEPGLFHRLPAAPHFFGREAEREELCRLWSAGHRGVVALVGLGGAGKTALAARFLEALLAPGALPRPDGLFVWSFYQEPDAGLFLREAHSYFGGAGG